MLEQRSKEWYEMRRGRFTASEIYKLLGKQGLGKTGETYCFEKAIEIVHGLEEDDFVSYDMKRGIELEPLAFRKFKELKVYDFVDVQQCVFFPIGDDAGVSPDGLVGEDECLEIKCPKREQFCKIVAFGMKEVNPIYIPQMQMQMLGTKSKKCHFFNYGIFGGKEYWHTIEVERDEDVIGLIQERLPIAIKLRNEYVEYLIKNQQF